MADKSRNIVIDYMKGIGILLMMLCHVFYSHNPWVYSFHMPLFIILAGYFAHVRTTETVDREFIIKSAKRLLLPFVVTSIMLICWSLVHAIPKHHMGYVWCQVACLFWACGDEIFTRFGVIGAWLMWFLISLFWCRIIFYYLAGFLRSRLDKYADELLIIICLALAFASISLHKVVGIFPWGIFQGVSMLPFYAAGYYYRHHQIHWSVKSLFILLWLIAVCYSNLDVASFRYDHYLLDVAGGCGGTYFLYLVLNQIAIWSEKWNRNIKKYFCQYSLVYWCGINSVLVLCMHSFESSSEIMVTLTSRLPFVISETPYAILRIIFPLCMAFVISKIPFWVKYYK